MRRGYRLYLVGSVILVAIAGCGRSFFQFEEREAWRREAELRCLQSGSVKESSALVRISPIEGPGICGAEFPLKVAALGETPVLGFADELRPPGAIPNASPSAQPRWPLAQPPRYAPPADLYSQPATPPYTAAPPPSPHGAPPYGMPPARPYGAPPAPAYGMRPTPVAPPDETYFRSASPGYAVMAPGEPLSLTPPGIPEPIEADAMQPRPSARPLPPPHPQMRATYGPPSSSPSDKPVYRAPESAAVILGPARDPRVTGAIGPVEVKPTATLACPIVSALDQWIAAAVQPAAMRWFGQPVTEIKQISAYSCRGMNGQSGAKISEHAFGNALDIASFTLADGRKVVVRTAWNGLPEEQGFLRDIQGAACQQFTTVLAPGSNRFHYDHIHVDLMRRTSGRQICQPAAMPGEVAAARAAQKNGYARRGDPTVTGSIEAKHAPSPADDPLEADDHEWIDHQAGNWPISRAPKLERD